MGQKESMPERIIENRTECRSLHLEFWVPFIS